MKRMSVRLAQILAFLIFAMSPIVQCAALAQPVGANPHVELTGSLHNSRYSHTATLLPNGQVLVAGGGNDSPGTHNTAELYDPDTGIWRLTGSLLSRRVYHSATLLPNGQVLVVGGLDKNPPFGREDYLNTAELYDPVTEVWRPTQSPIAMRGGSRALLLPDGRVLAVSFFDRRQVAELFDPSTESWSLTNPTSTSGWELALLPSGLVLAAGENSPELYDPATEIWSRTGNLNSIEWVQTLTVLRNGLVLATGSNKGSRETLAELYDPATGTWQLTGRLAQNRSLGQYTATLMPNGHVLVAGGADQFGNTLRSIELYDPAAGVWNPMPSLVVPRDYHTATLLANDKVLFAAGFEGDWYWFPTFHTSTELFDLGLRPLVGDFNADGKSDILWRNGERDLVAWQMNGMVISSNSLLPTASAGWSTSAVGDFNGDSKDDILWRSVSGDVGVWLMDGARVASFHNAGNAWTGWTISGVEISTETVAPTFCGARYPEMWRYG